VRLATPDSNEAVALFDLDGTLTDPESGITRSIAHALDGLGAEVPGVEALRRWIGPPLHRSFADYLGSAERADDALRLYRERFSTVGLYENEVYEGIVEALNTIGQSTARMLVVTSKPTVFARKIIDHFELDAYFDAVHGSELDGTHGDKTELLAHVLDAEKVAPHAATMIGDRRYDMAAAKQHDVRGIGVLWGFGDRDELAAAGADHICVSVSELPACYLNGN